MKTFRIKPLILLGLLLIIFFPVNVKASTQTQTRYLSSRTLLVYKGAGAGPSLVYKSFYQAKVGLLGQSCTTTYDDPDGSMTLYTGIRVYRRDANGTVTELTSGVSAIVSITYTGDWEALSQTWNAPNTTLSKTDILDIKAFSSNDNSTWKQFTGTFYSQWNTESLLAVRLLPSTWTIHYLVFYDWDGVTATHYFATAGTDNRASISNIQLDDGISSASSSKLSFSSGFMVALILAALGCIVSFAAGMMIKKR